MVTLLDTLKNLKDVSLVGVCDVKKDSPGVLHACDIGLDTYTDLGKCVTEKRIDIIIETSGSKEFQKVLNKIPPKEVKIVDSKAAELLMDLIKEKEKAKRYGQLYLVNKLSSVFSAEYDTHNIVRPIFNLLRDAFQIDVEAILVFHEPKNELIIAAGDNVSGNATQEIIDYLKRECVRKIKKDLEPQQLDILTQQISCQKGSSKKLKSFISIPLVTQTKEEGIMVLASSNDDAFNPEDIIVLNILGDELALFIENERIKKDLAEAKARLESMLHSMAEGVIGLDNKKEVTLINPAARLILGLYEVKLGMSFKEILRQQHIPDIFRDVSPGKDSRFITKEINFILDNKQKVIRFYIAQVFDGLGKPGGWIILLADITKEKEIDRMKSEFVSTTSHELRTPLTAIKESIMLVLDGTAGATTPEQAHFLSIAKRNINRLTDLISDLLDISKIETGKLQLKKIKSDIKSVIIKGLTPLYILAKQNGLVLRHEFEERLVSVECDPERIIQVITNLVGNSIKFTPKNGTIIVSCRLDKSFIEISVEDTGIGIDEDNIPKLFTRFDQLDASLTRRPGGTGLGLAICKELVEMHGGKIWVESKPKKGSKFIFTLPVASE